MHARARPAVQFLELLVFGLLTAHRTSGDDRGLRAGQLNTGFARRFARGNRTELGEAVEHSGVLGIEVRGRIVSAHLRAVREAQRSRLNALNRRDSGASGRKSVPKLLAIAAERADHAHASNDDAPHRLFGLARQSRRGVRCGHQFRDAVDSLADRGEPLGFFVGNADVELAFQCEKEVDAVEGIDLQFGKGTFERDARGIQALRLGDHCDDTAS